MKSFISGLITLIILVGSTYGISLFANSAFIDWAFFVGLVAVVILKLLNSSGGFISNTTNLSVQSATGIKIEEEKRKFTPSFPFYISIAYSAIGLVVILINYWDQI